MAEEPISEPERVRILLAEYTSLRSEIIARSGHAYQLMAFALGGIGLVVGLKPSEFRAWDVTSWAAAGAVVAGLAFGLWFMWREVMKEARRLREIELDINARAQEDLLVWENLWGGGVTGIFGAGRNLPRSHLSTLAMPQRTWRGRAIPAAPMKPVSALPVIQPGGTEASVAVSDGC